MIHQACGVALARRFWFAWRRMGLSFAISGALLALVPAMARAQTVVWNAPNSGTLGWCSVKDTGTNCYASPAEACEDLRQRYAPTVQKSVLTDTRRWDIKDCNWPNHSPLGGPVEWSCSGLHVEAIERCVASGQRIPARDTRVGQCKVCTEHPIDVLTGAKMFRAEDFTDERGLVLARTFVSIPVGNMHSSVVRRLSGLTNWAFDFEYELQIGGDWTDSQQVLSVITPQGGGYLFTRDSLGNMVPYNDGADVVPQNDYRLTFTGTWPSSPGSLTSNPSSWILTDPQDRTWYLQTMLDPAVQTYLIAKPVRMVEPGGREVKFTYGTSSELTAIADSNGNKITFDWVYTPNPAAITAAHLPGGETTKYVYQTLQPGADTPDRLIRVEFYNSTGALADTTSYVYGDSRFPTYVTQVKDRDGVVRWTAGYNEDGLATSSSGPGGAEQTTVAYTPVSSTFTRTVTDALGKVTTYTYTNTNASTGGYGIKLTGISTGATANTPASTASVASASDYSLAGVTDEENRTTAYTRDTAGRATQVIEAQGTPVARTTNISWLSDQNRPTQVAAAGLTIDYGYTAGSSAAANDGVPPGGHRYWRVRSSSTSLNNSVGIAELQMRSKAGGTDLTTGRAAAASASTVSTPAAQAINDKTTDFWSTGGAAPPSGGHWLSVDLVGAVYVNEVVVTVRPDSSREDPLNLFVEWSDDNASWTSAWSVPSISAWTAGQTRTFTNPAVVFPEFSVLPTVCGNPLVGGTLVGNPGVNSGASTTYRWLNDGVAIPGATGATYVVTTSDSGHALSFEVTATNVAGSRKAISPAFTGGIAGHCRWRVRATITATNGYLGIAELQTKTAPGGPNLAARKTTGASASAVGYSPASAVDGSASSFWTTGARTPPSGGHWLSVDYGRPVAIEQVLITVRPDQFREDPLNLYVDASDDNTNWVNQWSIASIAAWTAGETRTFDSGNFPPTFSIQPSVCGNPLVGATLVGNPGSHTGTSASYRWLSNGVAIPGATGLSYVVSAGDSGQGLSFEVTAINGAGGAVATTPTFTAGVAGHCVWRIRSSITAKSGLLGLAELQMRVVSGGVNLATGRPATASTAIGGYPTTNALDGNASTFWTTGASAPPSGGHWYSVRFDRPVPVNEVVVTVRPDAFREDPLNLFVESSDDSTAWTTDWSASSIPAWTAGQTRTFTKQ